MRNLSVDEINFVSGGEDIVVTANTSHKYDNNSIPAIFSASMAWASAYGSYLTASGRGGSSFTSSLDKLSSTGLVDTNGDGVPDSPEIVVTAPANHGEIQFANNQAQWNSYLGGVLVGALGFVSGLEWPSYVAGSVIGSPPVNRIITEANSDLIRDQISTSGGLHKYVKYYYSNKY